MMLEQSFFDRDPCKVARALLGKVIRKRYQGRWLAARIIETEAYYLNEKGSHSSLGFTEKRKALFMPAGTIYMYYARGKDSLNVSARGKGNAVLIKSAYPFFDRRSPQSNLGIMQNLNPARNGKMRPINRLCHGQTLLCTALNICLPDWDQQQFDHTQFYFDDADNTVSTIIQTTRLGIPVGRDEHKPYRFVDHSYAAHCTKNPLTQRKPAYTLLPR